MVVSQPLFVALAARIGCQPVLRGPMAPAKVSGSEFLVRLGLFYNSCPVAGSSLMVPKRMLLTSSTLVRGVRIARVCELLS